ncbi:MAG: glycosyltransferase family 4 protein [Patescibacteria group bacterium]
MRIAIYATNEYPYPVPAGYIHGVVTVAGALADGLTEMGHTVEFFCSEDSTTKANKRSLGYNSYINLPMSVPSGKARYQTKSYYAQRMARDMALYLRDHPVDVIHLHNVRDALPFMQFLPDTPKIVTVHDSLFITQYNFFLSLYKNSPNTYFVSISKRQQMGMPELSFYDNVYNGTDTNLFKFNPFPTNQVLFSGRFIPEKGVDIALQAAQQAHRPIHVIGFFDPRVELAKEFKQSVTVLLHQPYVKYTKKADYASLAKYYGQAQALLFPIQWEEAFGLVMIEAMSCGTPVIAFKRGSVPEIIKDGKTGFIVSTIPEMVRAIKKVSTISRRECREHVVNKFSYNSMIQKYQSVYEAVLQNNLKK